MYDEATIGARLRTLRRWRGMTLAQLADQAGLSKSFLSMAERGHRTLDRRSYIAAIAAALKVSEAELVGGPHLSGDPLQSDPHTTIPPLRVALETNSIDDPLCERARPLEILAAEMDAIEPLRAEGNYVALGNMLPALLDELHVHTAAPADEAAHELALKTMVEACVCASALAKNLGYMDLANLSARRAGEAAAILNSPVDKGKADFMRVLTMPRTGSWDRALTAAERAANALEPHAVDAVGVQVLGMITLAASLAAAATNNTAAAGHWLDSAAKLAHRIPDEPRANWQCFSATNVGVWRVAVGVECGKSGGAVAELARGVDENKLGRSSSRRASFLADVGRGLARDRQSRDQAVRLLRSAESIAPQRIRNSGPVREAVAVMLQQATSLAGGRELRGMAARMRIPH
jgi:transcriptional regulator with XRE-family HTH domain